LDFNLKKIKFLDKYFFLYLLNFLWKINGVTQSYIALIAISNISKFYNQIFQSNLF